jgi:probable blue pigment (indigoidine) exporter
MAFMKQQPTISYWLVGLPFSALWASASVASKIGLRSAQPFTISLTRFSIAALIMIGVTHLVLRHPLPKKGQWKQLAVYGLLNIALYLGLFIVAIQEVSAGLGTLAVAINPVLITISAAVWRKEKISFLHFSALALGLVGVAICAYPLILGSHATIKGLLILFISMMVYSAGTIYFQEKQWEGMHILTINGWQTFFGAIFTIPFFAFNWERDANQFDINFWGGTLWLVVGVSIAAVQSWIYLLRNFGASSTYWLFLSPIFGFTFSNLLMHEPLGMHTWIGTLLVLIGLYVHTRSVKK